LPQQWFLVSPTGLTEILTDRQATKGGRKVVFRLRLLLELILRCICKALHLLYKCAGTLFYVTVPWPVNPRVSYRYSLAPCISVTFLMHLWTL